MQYYNWVLAFHVMSFISWMAALFYMPRLFVYHRENSNNSGFLEVITIQEYKLFKYIGVPAMWATIFSGAFMVYLNSALLNQGWFHAKLTFVALLIIFHFSLEVFRKKLNSNPNYKSGKFFRIYNEIPTLLMIAIVIFVVVKPF